MGVRKSGSAISVNVLYKAVICISCWTATVYAVENEDQDESVKHLGTLSPFFYSLVGTISSSTHHCIVKLCYSTTILSFFAWALSEQICIDNSV